MRSGRSINLSAIFLSASWAIAIAAGCGAVEPQADRKPVIAMPTSGDPVKALAWITPDGAKAGRNATVHVGVRIAAGYHIQPMDGASGLPPTSLSMTPCPQLSPAGDWAVAGSSRAAALVDSAEFMLPVTVSRGTTAGVYQIPCTITFVACNDELCWPARTIALKPVLSVAQ